MKISLNCIFLGTTDLSDSFTVPVCDKNDINGNVIDFDDLKIGDLKFLIWNKKKGMLKIDDPDTLILWKVALGDYLKDIITEEQIKNKGEVLVPIELLSNYFSNKNAANK
ncbi:14510_t:CDS:1, partial [Funneliformis mosseae]